MIGAEEGAGQDHLFSVLLIALLRAYIYVALGVNFPVSWAISPDSAVLTARAAAGVAGCQFLPLCQPSAVNSLAADRST